MNRRELDAMRERLAARSASEGEEHPAAAIAAGVLFAAVILLACFI
jgi:hypothetical protein